MKKLLVYLFSVMILGGSATVFYFLFAHKHYDRNDMSNFHQLLSSKENYDIVLMGSSRTMGMMNPRLIDSITGMNSYNFGLNGTSILETRMMMRKYLQLHAKPKLILLNVDFNGFYSSGFLFNATDYYQYLNDTLIKNSLAPYNKNYGSSLTRRVNQLEEIFAEVDQNRYYSLFGIPKPPDVDTYKVEFYKGFQGRELQWSASAENDLNTPRTATYDEQGFELLKSFIAISKSDSVPIVLVHAPIISSIRKTILNYDEIFSRIKKISSETSTPYWEYDTMKICDSKKYFRDLNHLNLTGANIYSAQLARDVKSYLQTVSKNN